MTADTSAPSRLARIADAVHAHAPTLAERDTPYIEAAIMLVLRAAATGAIELLFIKRAARTQDPWSGQIALEDGLDSVIAWWREREREHPATRDRPGSGADRMR